LVRFAAGKTGCEAVKRSWLLTLVDGARPSLRDQARKNIDRQRLVDR
jgi:hypothetical protein